MGMIKLTGSHSDDPTPDLIGVAPDNRYVFTNMRGVHPLTANNKTVNNAKGSTPGVMIIQVNAGGRSEEVLDIVRITNMKNGKEPTDPHGLAVRD